MTIARRKQICLELTPYYHCTTNCVRGAYLCGYDKATKKNNDHRRGWIEERLLLLCEVFCIEIAGYAVMSNHYHVVVKVDEKKAKALSDCEVIDRWLKLYKGTDLIRRYRAGMVPSKNEFAVIKATLALWRDQLSNLSRFMGNLNETIARRANKEDNCRGRFWESRFDSQAILDLQALLRTLCYVDLNPVRAKMADTPEQSLYTSVHRRIKMKGHGLMPFRERNNHSPPDIAKALPITFDEYLTLLDWTGRELRDGKRGAIDAEQPPILTRLGYTSKQWLKNMRPRVTWTERAVGSAESIKAYCEAIGQMWIWQLD